MIYTDKTKSFSIKKINKYIRDSRTVSSILIVGSILSSIYFIVWIISYKILNGWDIVLDGDPNASLLKGPLYITVLEAMIIGPIIETLIFQKFLYFIATLFGWFRHNKCRIVILGTFIFGLAHFFTLLYIITTAITGAFFMYLYVIKQHRHAYWSVVMLHSMINGLAIFLSYFE